MCLINYWNQSTPTYMKHKMIWQISSLFALTQATISIHSVLMLIIKSSCHHISFKMIVFDNNKVYTTQICLDSGGVNHGLQRKTQLVIFAPLRAPNSILQCWNSSGYQYHQCTCYAGYSLSVQCPVLHYRPSWHQKQNNNTVSKWYCYI